MANSTRQKRRGKADRPKKPYPDFPLTPHASGAWMKKINGKIFYFHRWARTRNGKLEKVEGDGWKEALALYKAQADDLHAGRTPRVRKVGEGLILSDLCNRFLTSKQRKVKAGEITTGTFAACKVTTDLIIGQFGKARLVDDLVAEDFGTLRAVMAERWGPVRLGNEITRVRSVFKFGYDSGIIKNAVRYGPEFVKPSASVLRRHKAKNGERMLEADQCRRLLDATPVQLRAMILLGLNCGFIGKDCADLPLSAIKGEWIDFPRPKTGIARRCPLWPETVEALEVAITERPEPRLDTAEGSVFITRRGRSWLSCGQSNQISVATNKLMKEIGVHRAGIGFATLRHVFRTVADGSRDQVAINHIMGHADATMAATYRERIDDSRLIAVVQHVRAWLWPQSPEEKTDSVG